MKSMGLLDATAEPALEVYILHHTVYIVYFCTAPLSYCSVSLSLCKYNDSNAQLESISLFVLSQPIKQILKYQFTDTENKICELSAGLNQVILFSGEGQNSESGTNECITAV